MIFWIAISLVSLIAIAVLLRPLLQKKSKEIFAAILVISLPVFAILLYQKWGAYTEVKQASLIKTRLAEVKQQIATDGSRQALIKQFEAHLHANPDSAKGWYLLGKLYLGEGERAQAVDALAKSNTLKPDDAETMLAFAEAKFLHNEQKLDPEAQTLLKSVLTIEPNAVGAYNLLAIDAFNSRKFKEAVVYWEKILTFYPPGSEEVKSVLELIAKAQAA